MKTDSLASIDYEWGKDIVGLVSEVTNPDVPVSTFKGTDLAATTKLDENCVRAIKEFAQANGFSYQPGPLDIQTSTKPHSLPAWMMGGMAAIKTHIVTGTMCGFDFEMFHYYKDNGSRTFSNLSSNSSSEARVGVWKMGIVRVKLHKTFPQLLLDSNKNDRGLLSTINISPDKTQRLSLEGDFDEYFDFYAPRNLQIDALTVLAPNFMQQLKNSSQYFDVEFFGNEMTLISKEPLYRTDTMLFLQEALTEQLQYLERLEKSWSYNPSRGFDTLVVKSQTGSLKVGKLRIPTAAFGYIFLIVFITIIVLLVSRTVTIKKPECVSSQGNGSYSLECK